MLGLRLKYHCLGTKDSKRWLNGSTLILKCHSNEDEAVAARQG